MMRVLLICLAISIVLGKRGFGNERKVSWFLGRRDTRRRTVRKPTTITLPAESRRRRNTRSKCSPFSLAHGSVSYSTNRRANGLYETQTRATITCDSGYICSNQNARCQSGSWKGGIPTCEALYDTVGNGYCKGNGNHKAAGVRNIGKNIWVTAKECKSMCSSLDSCAGYSFRPSKRFCAVYVGSSMTSAPSGWTLNIGCSTCPALYCSTISRSTGKPESNFKCYKKRGYVDTPRLAHC